MSDLQCAATVVFVDPDALACARVGERFAHRAPAGVFASPSVARDPDALATVTRLARGFGCVVGNLAEAHDPAGLRAAVCGVCDLHRGETVVVVAELALIRGALAHEVQPPISVAIDDDGWLVVAERAAAR